MSRSVLLVSPWLGALASCVATTGAVASDLTIRGRASQTIELNDNYGLTTAPNSGVLGSYSSGSLSALYRTPTTRFMLNGDIVYRKYFGPGVQNASTETISDGLNMRFERDGRELGSRDFIFGSYRRDDANILQRDDLGFSTTNIRGDVINYTAGAGSSRRLSDKDTVSGSINAAHTTYSPSSPETTPFTNLSASGGWSHRATHTIDLMLSSSVGYLIYDNTANTKTLTARTTGGASIQLSDRLSVSGNAGVTYFNTKQDSPGPVVIVPGVNDPFSTPLFVPAPAVAGITIGPTWDASINYRLLKTTSTSLSFSQGTTPGALGDLSSRTQITASANHTINSVSYLSMSAGYGIVEPPSGGIGSTVINGTLSYSYRLAREWNATATYYYRQISRDATTGSGSTSASSNALLFVLSKEFVLKP